MKKIIRTLSICLALIFVCVLASCNKSGVKVVIEEKISSKQITFDLTFDKNDKIESLAAVPHIKRYEYDEAADDNIGSYLNDNQTCTFENSVYTKSNVTFTNLTPGTKYTFCLYVSYNAEEELIKTWVTETSKYSTEAIEINSIEDFNKMSEYAEGNYKLMTDLDFEGEKIKSQFTTSTKFKGTFDGNGKTISNFTLDYSSCNGIFAYTDGATIKNVTIDAKATEEQITYDASSGKSTANVGILAGDALNTTFENCKVLNASFLVSCQSTAKLYLGALVGKADKCLIKDSSVKNVNMEIKRIRGEFKCGLLVGSLSSKLQDAENTMVNCSADGKIDGILYYPSSSSSVPQKVRIGGLIGETSNSPFVKDSYAVANIELWRYEGSSTDKNEFTLALGGLIGEGTMKLDGCAAIADFTVNANDKNSSTLGIGSMLNAEGYYVRVGGLVGMILLNSDTINNCVYVKKNVGITMNALEKDDDDCIFYVTSNTIAESKTPTTKYTNVGSLVDAADIFDTTVLADNVKSIVESSKK